MMNTTLLLILVSPFTAFIPLFKLLTQVLSDRTPIHFNRYNICLLGLFIWSLFSSAINKDWLSTMASFAFALYFAVTIWIYHSAQTHNRMEFLIKTVWKFSLFPAFLGIVERVLAFFFDFTWLSRLFWNPTYVPSRAHYRIFSTFGNPNVAADWFAVMALISLYFLEQAQTRRERLIYGSAGLLFGLDLFLTGSKGAFLGAFCALTLYAVIRRSRWIWALLAALLTAGMLILVLLPESLSAVNPRNTIWINALHLFKTKPVTGWGVMGLFSQIHEVHAHNIWLGFLSALGGIGLILYLEMRWYVIEGLFMLLDSGIPMAPMLVAVQVMLCIHGIFDFTIMSPQIGILFFGSCACINALAHPAAAENPLPVFLQNIFILFTKEKAV